MSEEERKALVIDLRWLGKLDEEAEIAQRCLKAADEIERLTADVEYWKMIANRAYATLQCGANDYWSGEEVQKRIDDMAAGKKPAQSDAEPITYPTLACPDSKLAELVNRWEARPQSDAEPAMARLARGIAACDQHIADLKSDPLGVDQMALGSISITRKEYISELSRLRAAQSNAEPDNHWSKMRDDGHWRTDKQEAIAKSYAPPSHDASAGLIEAAEWHEAVEKQLRKEADILYTESRFEEARTFEIQATNHRNSAKHFRARAADRSEK